MSFLGDRFKQEREARDVAILQIEIDTRIRANVIQAIEDGDYASLPPEPFLRGLIRSYANYLGIDPQEMVELYAADIQPIQPSQLRPAVTPNGMPPPPPNIPQQPPVPMPPATPSMLPPKPQPTFATKPSETNGIKPTLAIPIIKEPKPVVADTPIEFPVVAEPVLVSETSSEPALSIPPPDMPPEMLPPPEHIEHGERTPTSELQALATVIMQRGLPMPVLVLVILAILFSCIALGLLIATQVGPLASFVSTAPTITPTRIPPTITRTLVPGSGPTSVPTLPVTAAPFPTFPGNPTATSLAPRRTLETVNSLNLDMDVTTSPVTAQIGIDGVLVFSGSIAAGTSRSWSARDTLYLRVENPKNATIKLNGKPVLPNVFSERNLIERQWTLNDRGVPILETPVPPAVLPGAPPPATPGLPRVNPTPTATLTPFS